MAAVRRLSSDELRPRDVAALRDLFSAAWSDHPDGEFTDEDWDHAVGGIHFILEEGQGIVAHASVVRRELQTTGHRLVTGYVEAVATWPAHQRRGYASAVMRHVGEHIDRDFQLGGLATGSRLFYERLGWTRWRGPTFVRTDGGLVRTAEDDGYILVRLTPTTPDLDLSAPISCDWRPGDAW